MLTIEEVKTKMARLSEIANDDEEAMSLLSDIQTDYNDRTVYGEEDVFDTDGKRYSEKYSDMRKKYREAFFGEVKRPVEEEPSEDKAPTFEDLFK